MKSDSPAVLLFFIDGLGIGERGSANPFDGLRDAEPLANFAGEAANLPYQGILVPTDPCLGVAGRPQSASGQTTILTGVNAPARLGYHKQGFPNKALLEIINEHSIFRQLTQAGISEVTFANAYTEGFFQDRPRWVSATTAAVEAAGLTFRRVNDLANGEAVYQDFSNAVLIERGIAVKRRTAHEAATVLANIVARHRFTLYEYFITDKIGHAQDFDAARTYLPQLALLVREVLRLVDLDRTSVILTSDHGNVEDLSARTHTLNAVPTMVWGPHRKQIAARINSLVDITPTIVATLTQQTTLS